ncbi:MAG: 16S rRNA processing protein RimM [Lachnospiraceae bacterium]|nr:16S rRNA processing protein RimM [Lachnospiraceae bacterium]
MEEFLKVGIITSTHGVHGEVKVFPTTDDVKRFKKLKEVLLDTERDGMLPLKITGVKFSKQLVILRFEGYENPNDIEKYKGKSLFVTRENAVPLGKDEYYIADLIGMEVISEEGDRLGTLKEVMQNIANDVYIIEQENGEELLLPAIKQCILSVDVEKMVMRVRQPEDIS